MMYVPSKSNKQKSVPKGHGPTIMEIRFRSSLPLNADPYSEGRIRALLKRKGTEQNFEQTEKELK